MSQIQTAGAVTETVEIDGKRYTLSTPPIVDLYAGLENCVLANRPDPLAIAVQACALAPQAQHPAIWDAAIRQKSATARPSQSEIDAYLNTPAGIAYVLWTCLREKHAAEFPTPASLLPVVQRLAQEKLTEILLRTQIVTGEAEAKN